jgi:hypothetical protein
LMKSECVELDIFYFDWMMSEKPRLVEGLALLHRPWPSRVSLASIFWWAFELCS